MFIAGKDKETAKPHARKQGLDRFGVPLQCKTREQGSVLESAFFVLLEITPHCSHGDTDFAHRHLVDAFFWGILSEVS
jgi:hypothetical protein